MGQDAPARDQVCTRCNLWRATGLCGCCHRPTVPYETPRHPRLTPAWTSN